VGPEPPEHDGALYRGDESCPAVKGFHDAQLDEVGSEGCDPRAAAALMKSSVAGPNATKSSPLCS